MINEIFQSLHEAVKRRNTPDSFIPLENKPTKDVIHRGYLNKTGVPIKYDFIPDGSHANSGTHVYNYKNKTTRALLTISHKITDPKKDGHESQSEISYENMSGDLGETPIDTYRTFILPSFLHHIKTHNPEIITLDSTLNYSDDMMRRLGSNFDISIMKNNGTASIKATKKLDSKIKRVLASVKKSLNKK